VCDSKKFKLQQRLTHKIDKRLLQQLLHQADDQTAARFCSLMGSYASRWLIATPNSAHTKLMHQLPMARCSQTSVRLHPRRENQKLPLRLCLRHRRPQLPLTQLQALSQISCLPGS
jgi:hypothetical protein